MPLSYPLDTTGLSTSNRIINESHTFTEINNSRHRIIIPVFAPFYLDNINLIHVASDGSFNQLVENQHYILSLPYIGATRSIGKTLYGGISFNSNMPNGTLLVSYQTLGGDWTADSNYVLERLATMVYNPRITVWDIVTNKPNQFPPINHNQSLDFIFGYQELINAVNNISANINSRPFPNKVSIGLGNVENLPTATNAEVLSEERLDKYVTLRQLVYMLRGGVL